MAGQSKEMLYMALVYEEVIPTPIPNTTIRKGIINGVHRNYQVEPLEGYVLHDKASDYMGIDPETMEAHTVLGFNQSYCSCPANYDFVANPREFYAVPESEVPNA
jgi:hypothetical protein